MYRRPSSSSVSRLLLGAALLGGVLGGGCHREIHPDFSAPFVCRPTTAVTSSVFLIGDAGDPDLPELSAGEGRGDDRSGGPPELVDPVLRALASDVATQVHSLGEERTAVVFLGDNVYPDGLAPEGDDDRARGERVLEAQIAAAGAARGFFVLGNHDWDQADEGGYERAMAQWRYLSERAPNIEIHPPRACPGPSRVDFGEHLRFVFVDAWSRIYDVEYPGSPVTGCDPRPGGGRARAALEAELHDHDDRRVVLALHQPLMSSGPHAGYFSWTDHIFPLRVFNRHLWIPLPILGSIFPVARWSGVTDVDLMSTSYSVYIESVMDLFEPGVPSLVVAGHDHSLQVHVDAIGVFHAVSGAGSTRKVNNVSNLESDLMSLAAPGYMRLDEYGDGTLMLTVFALDEEDRSQRVYATCVP